MGEFYWFLLTFQVFVVDSDVPNKNPRLVRPQTPSERFAPCVGQPSSSGSKLSRAPPEENCRANPGERVLHGESLFLMRIRTVQWWFYVLLLCFVQFCSLLVCINCSYVF